MAIFSFLLISATSAANEAVPGGQRYLMFSAS
jgi:hypothetical protein